MYELPEYVEGKKYWSIFFCCYTYGAIKEYRWEPTAIHTRDKFNLALNDNLAFATSELAKIEADRRNAQNKLMNLAREREKEFPIDWENAKQEKIKPRFSFRLCDGRCSIDVDIDTEYVQGDTIYFSGFTIYDELGMLSFNFEKWLCSVMTESEIKALCMERKFV